MRGFISFPAVVALPVPLPQRYQGPAPLFNPGFFPEHTFAKAVMKDRYTIGEVSRICNISRKALRYYDDIGLIPSHRDGSNNYRYYSRDSLLTVPVIKYYKQMGFKLDEMRTLIPKGECQTIKQGFESKIRELEGAREALLRKYDSVTDWYGLILEAEQVRKAQSWEVGCRYVEPTVYLFQEQVFDHDLKQAIINLDFTRHVEGMDNEIIGPVMIHFPSMEDRIQGTPGRITIMQKALSPHADTETRCFGGQMMLSCYHIGPHDTLGKTYDKIRNWAGEKGYVLQGSCHERYVTDYWTTRDPKQFVTEVLVTADQSRMKMG